MAVDHSRKSIADLMNIRPDYANLKINEDIKWTINQGFDFLCYYIDGNTRNDTNGFGVKQCIREYYDKYNTEFPNIDITNMIYNFKLTNKWMNKIQELDCVKDFVKKFLDDKLQVSIIPSEEDEFMKIKVYLFNEKIQ
jgi:hypothetical protein